MRANALRLTLLAALSTLFFVGMRPSSAQPVERAAQLRVESPGVEMRRAGTTAWVPLRTESIIGVGDRLRTKEVGRGTVYFLNGALLVQIFPNSEIAIDTYRGKNDEFTLDVRVVVGQTRQSTSRVLSEKSAFNILTPGFSARVNSGISFTRVETSRRSAVLTSKDGELVVGSDRIQGSQGVRAEPQKPVSEIVPADDFTALDVALDGCPSTISLAEDIQINVRAGAEISYSRIGGLDNKQQIIVIGRTQTIGWYRIRFDSGYGWIRYGDLNLNGRCEADLRVFPDRYGPEKNTPNATPSK